MDMVSQLIVNCGEKLKGDLAKLIIALLKGADKVETPTMSMLSVMSGANPNTQEIIDSHRAASARTLSSSDVLSKVSKIQCKIIIYSKILFFCSSFIKYENINLLFIIYFNFRVYFILMTQYYKI